MSVEPQPRRTASESPAVAALRELKAAQPDLAPAADLQIELAQITRRVSARAPLPALAASDVRQARLADGVRVLSFADFRFEWSDVRLALREVARALEAVGALPAAGLSRRAVLNRFGMGLGGIALANLINPAPGSAGPLQDPGALGGQFHARPRAKRVL